MNFRLLFIISIILYSSCKEDAEIINLPYRNKLINSVNKGIPKDSTISYFSNNDTLKTIDKDVNDIDSYLLFKLSEPILSDHYLGKQIYRITAKRSFHEPIVIRIEKSSTNITLQVKKLNKNIGYPFSVYGKNWWTEHEMPKEIAYYDTSLNDSVIVNLKEYKKVLEKNKRYDDSLSIVYNKIDYYITSEKKLNLTTRQWDSLENYIWKTQLWYSKPYTLYGHAGLDGSAWTIEGHIKDGYQCITIINPFVPDFTESAEEEKELQEKSRFAILLRFICDISGIDKDEKIY